MRWYWLLLGILSTWRVSLLLSAEDGPGQIIARVRRKAGNGFWGELMDCFYCLSLWIAAPLAIVLGDGLRHSALLWLTLSAGAILVERVTGGEKEHRASYVEHSHGGDDGMLPRREDDSSPPNSSRESG